MRTLSFIALLTVGCGDISDKDEDTSQDASPSCFNAAATKTPQHLHSNMRASLSRSRKKHQY